MIPKWLYRAVHDSNPPRKPPAPERRGPLRDAAYRQWIRTLPSVVSGRLGCDACHTRNNGLSSKGPDDSCVPLTRAEHRAYDAGRAAFERAHGVIMADVVRELNARWRRAKERAA